MSIPQDLMGLGMAPGLANRLGNQILQNVAGVGTAQVGATALFGKVTTATTSVGQTAFILNSGASNGSVWYFWNQSATAALMYPTVGGQINGGGTNTAFSVPQNKPCIFVRVAPNVWFANLSA